MRGKERMSKQNSARTWRIFGTLLLGAALLLAAFGAGMAAMWYMRPSLEAVAERLGADSHGEPGAAMASKDRGALLWQVWDLLERDYVDPSAIDDKRMIHGATAGMASSLGDPSTVFVEPIPAAIIDEDMTGSFEGIGATVEMVEGRLVLVDIMPDSPASRSGLVSGDLVLQVDDEPLDGKTVLQAVALIRGPKGTVVRLLIQREGLEEPFVVPVTRDRVELIVVRTRMLEGDIAYLSLAEFNAVSRKRVQQGLKELLAHKPRGLILDLRNNPGGYLQMAVDIASEFLPRGTLVLTEKERGDEITEFRVKKSGIATEIPLVILVNGSTASASEIVAGAVQDHDRGILIGEETYGKGSVQITHSLDDGSSLRVTTARWYLPNGQNLDEQGIMPNLPVEMTASDRETSRDPQLERAIEYLLNDADRG